MAMKNNKNKILNLITTQELFQVAGGCECYCKETHVVSTTSPHIQGISVGSNVVNDDACRGLCQLHQRDMERCTPENSQKIVLCQTVLPEAAVKVSIKTGLTLMQGTTTVFSGYFNYK